MATPIWVLALVYWLHMLATVVWIGSLTSLSILVLPAARQILDSQDYAGLLGKIQKRLDPLAWFSLLLLLATGMVQMAASPNYKGFLAVDDRWAAAILIKHILFAVLILLSMYMTWILLPALRRHALRSTLRKTDPQTETNTEALQQREVFILRVNLLLGVIILAFTAIARTS